MEKISQTNVKCKLNSKRNFEFYEATLRTATLTKSKGIFSPFLFLIQISGALYLAGERWPLVLVHRKRGGQ